MEKTEVQHQVHLEGAIKILTGDLSEEAGRAGIDNQLQRWIEDLKATHNAEFHQLVTDLQALKALLHGGTYNSDQVGRLLHHLGTETTRVAHFAEGNTLPHVEKLGAALLAAAGQLQGSATTPEQDLKNNNRGLDTAE
jgi:ABC-type transporter Mla subunit MlaD